MPLAVLFRGLFILGRLLDGRGLGGPHRRRRIEPRDPAAVNDRGLVAGDAPGKVESDQSKNDGEQRLDFPGRGLHGSLPPLRGIFPPARPGGFHLSGSVNIVPTARRREQRAAISIENRVRRGQLGCESEGNRTRSRSTAMLGRDFFALAPRSLGGEIALASICPIIGIAVAVPGPSCPCQTAV